MMRIFLILDVSKPQKKVCECENNGGDNDENDDNDNEKHSEFSQDINYIPKKNNNSKFFSIIRGNVVLAEYGYSIENEYIGYFSQEEKRFYPRLSKAPLSFSRVESFSDNNMPSCYSLLKESSPLLTKPSIIIKEIYSSNLQDTLLDKNDQSKMTEKWQPVNDLFSSNEFDRHFVVEIDDELFANLLFGDGDHGMEPKKSSDRFFYKYHASYKIGNGTRGNVGKQAITSITQSSSFDPRGIIIKLYNPDDAKGGIDYEDIESARLISPEKILHTKERAVTENDYREIVKRYPGVDHVYIKFQWTGSWYTVFIAIDRKDNKKIDENFKRGLNQYLDNFKLSCYDIQIKEPIFVPLYIKLKIWLKPNILKSEVRRLLFKKFSNIDLDDGTKGFFHPDNFTFGQSLYLSKIYQHVMQIIGILSVEVLTFARLGRIVEDEENKDTGFIKIKKNEIIRLDNDSNLPKNGKIDFVIEGGI